MKNRLCKKCKKPLPEGYPHKKCEACRNAQVQSMKKVVNATGAIASVAVVILSKGKFNPKK